MTVDPDHRLAHYLTNEPATLQRIADVLGLEDTDEEPRRIAEAIAYAITGYHGSGYVGVEAVQLLRDALEHVIALGHHAGPAAGRQEIERLLDANSVATVILELPVWKSVDELRAHCGIGPLSEEPAP